MPTRLSATLATLIALAASGCGEDSGGSTDGKALDATTPSKADETARKRGHTEKPENRRNPKAREKRPEKAEQPSEPESLEEAVRRLPKPKRLRALRQRLRPILENAGIAGATVALSSDRKTLTLTVPASQACDATTTDEGRLAEGVREVLPFVRDVRILVAGGTPLEDYAASHCERPALPPGRGRVVLEQSGFGSTTSKAFRIRSERWAVEYAQQSDFFSIFVAKGASGQRYERGTVISQSPGSGRKTYKGPGTFRLEINGSGDWTVRVRELP
jgi:hypothetical protein